MASVSFQAPTDYAAEQEQIARSRKYAELLQAQSMEAQGPTETVGGWAIRKSPLEGLAKMLKGYSASKMMESADDKQKTLADRIRQQGLADVSSFTGALQGTPARPEIPANEMDYMGTAAAPAQAPDRSKALAIALQSQNPMVQGAGSAMLSQMLKAQDPYSLREGEKRYGANGEVLAANDKRPEVKTLGPGQSLVQVGAQGTATPLMSVAEKAPESLRTFTESMKSAGIDPASTQGKALMAQFVQKQATHQQPNMQNVTVNTEKQLFGHMAEGVGKDIATAAQNAKAAVGTLNTVNQIREALDTGKVMAGPGTTARVFLGQVGQVLGVAGKDATETLTKTRSAIQGMAQLELDAAQQMKGQGQITEAERGIIRRAASGDIDGMTVPELRVLTDTLDKTARFKIKQNAANVARVKANPQSASLAEFMDVPEPQPYTPKTGTSPDVEALLKKYGKQ